MTCLSVAISPISNPAPSRFVLVVDDDTLCLDLLRVLLESAGHRCVTASSGAEALARCDEQRPLAVVTDFSMPGLDGAVLAHWFRARYPEVPLVMMTGQDLDAPAMVELRRDFTAILQKPCDPERLLAVLHEHLPPARRSGPGSGLP